jgi:anti-sigma B factor antagonist
VRDEIVVRQDDPRVTVIELVGEHDGYSARKIGASIDAALADERDVVVDLGRATFLDSTVISQLLVAQRAAKELPIGFAIVLGSSTGWPVRTVFEVAHLQEVFPVAPTLDAALERLGDGGPDRRRSGDRRSGADRRRGFTASPIGERRVAERRSGADRRR